MVDWSGCWDRRSYRCSPLKQAKPLGSTGVSMITPKARNATDGEHSPLVLEILIKFFVSLSSRRVELPLNTCLAVVTAGLSYST